MNPLKKYLGSILLILALTAMPAFAFANATCGETASQGNISFNFSINGTNHCVAGNFFNITAVNTDTNISKNFSFDGTSNWSMSVHLTINNTDNSSVYSVKIFNATAVGNTSHNVTVTSNTTGRIQFNMTGFNNTGYVNFTKRPGGTRPADYVMTAVFAAIIAGGAAIYLRRIRKV
jgi:hypothetical protein